MFDPMYSYDMSGPMVAIDRRYRPNVEIAPDCPRCDSSNTKFCYYNNYSLTQPRYFCKGCRRYWTKGGSLRNVPVGGGCRKNRRRSKSSARLSVNDSANNYGRRVASSDCIRPDIALDSICSGLNDHGTSTATTTIDLAMVYSKFLNPDQPTATQAGSSSSSDQIGMTREFENYPFDQNSIFESLAIDSNAIDQGDGIFSMNCEVLENLAWPEQGYFGNSVLEFGMTSHHHQDVMEDDWCGSIDQSSFGGFLM